MDDWLDHYRRFWSDQLRRLKRHVEGAGGGARIMKHEIVETIEIAATPERVFRGGWSLLLTKLKGYGET